MHQNARRIKSIVWLIGMLIFFAVSCLFFCKFQITQIDGHSMEPTLKNRQIILVGKTIKEYEKGTIITFMTKKYGICVKRVEGVAGDFIEIKEGKVFRNHIQIKEYYSDSWQDAEYRLKENELFVVGDNTKESIDSRSYGPICTDDVIGEVYYY